MESMTKAHVDCKNGLKVTFQEMKQKIEELEPCMTLPVVVNKEEIKAHQVFGTDFNNHEDFLKQTIVNALANSQKMTGDADYKM